MVEGTTSLVRDNRCPRSLRLQAAGQLLPVGKNVGLPSLFMEWHPVAVCNGVVESGSRAGGIQMHPGGVILNMRVSVDPKLPPHSRRVRSGL